jgi:hypothetical protein
MSAFDIAAPTVRESRITPFTVFGVVAVAAAAWAIYQMVAWASVPAFGNSAWPTTIGILIALAIFFAVGLRAPPND